MSKRNRDESADDFFAIFNDGQRRTMTVKQNVSRCLMTTLGHIAAGGRHKERRCAMQKPKAMFVKRRGTPMLAAVVAYNEATGKRGKVLASEPIRSDFSNADVEAAARRLVPQVPSHDVVLPTGIEL